MIKSPGSILNVISSSRCFLSPSKLFRDFIQSRPMAKIHSQNFDARPALTVASAQMIVSANAKHI